MKIAKSLAAAAVFAAASLGSSAALADDISSGPQGLALLHNTAFFGDSFAMNNNGNTFSDQFVFSITGQPANLDAIVASVADAANLGLDITALSLYGSGGDLIANGSSSMTGAVDVWTISADALATGNYYLQVSGTLVSNAGASFGGSVALNPVPEPETYGMMIAGLGVLGFLARRRKAANQA
jgi:hypothetical protein